MKTRVIDPELLRSLDGLYRCHAASTISFLYRWLRMIRTQICRGFVVLIPDDQGTVIQDLPEFYAWVAHRYPDLHHDPLRSVQTLRDDRCTVEWSDWHGQEAC